MNKVTLLFTLFAFLFVLPLAAKENPDAEMIDNSIVIDRIGNQDIDVLIPSPVFSFRDVNITLKFKNPGHTRLLVNKNVIDFIVNGEDKELTFVNGEATFSHRFDKSNSLSIYAEDFSYNATVTAYPLWAVLVPVVLIIGWIVLKKTGKKKDEAAGISEEKKAA